MLQPKASVLQTRQAIRRDTNLARPLSQATLTCRRLALKRAQTSKANLGTLELSWVRSRATV
jgi:hypothetical protein